MRKAVVFILEKSLLRTIKRRQLVSWSFSLALLNFVIFALTAFTTPALATSQSINIQGKVTNANGTNVADGVYDFVFKLYDGAGSTAANTFTESWTAASLWNSTMTVAPAANGTSLTYSSDVNEASLKPGQLLWNTTKQEAVKVVAVNTATNVVTISATAKAWATSDTVTNRIFVKDGIFQVALNSLNQNWGTTDFNQDLLHVGINFNNDGEMKPRSQLNSVAQAYRALSAATVDGLTITAGKTVTFQNSLTFGGTDGTSFTLPGTSDTLVGLTATQTLTNKTITTSGLLTASNGFTLSGGTLTLPANSVTDAMVSNTLTASIFIGTGSTSNAVDLATAEVAGTLTIARGGTNSTATPTAGGLAYGTGSAFAFTAAGTTGQCILSNGAAAPSWGTCYSIAADSLDFTDFSDSLSLDAATNIALGAFNLTTSGTGGIVFNHTGTTAFAGSVGIGTTSPNAKIDLSYGGANGSFLIGADVNADTRTLNTRKIGRIVGPSYSGDGTGLNVFIMGSDTNATQNLIDIGGVASGTPYAATNIRFYTGATNTTQGGTEAMHINSSQRVGIGVVPGTTARFHVRDTTQQLRIDYDSANAWTTEVSSVGLVTFDATGTGAGFVFADGITTNGSLSIANGLTVTSGSVSLPNNAISDAMVSDTLTASIFKGSGSTTDAIDLATAEVAGILPNSKLTGSGALTVTAGTGLSGGGSVALGASTTLALDMDYLDKSYGGTHINNTASATKTYYYIAKLPATTAGTYDSVMVELYGGPGFASGGQYDRLLFKNRNAFQYNYSRQGSVASTSNGIEAFQQVDGSVDLYYYHNGTYTSSFVRAHGFQTDSTTRSIRVSTTGVTVAPTGTTIFDSQSAAYPPNANFAMGGLSVANGLTLSGGALSLPASSVTDAMVSDTLTASIYKGSGSTTNAVDLGTAEVAGTLANSNLVNSGALTITAGTGMTGGGSVALGGTTTIGLANTTVTAASYGSASTATTFTVDAQGRLTAAGTTSIAIAASQVTSGTLSVARGGTGATSLTANGLLYGGATVGVTAAGTNGQIVVGVTSGAPAFVTVSGDATITNTGVITLKNTGTAGSYGAANQTLTVTTDAQGRVSGITAAAIAIDGNQITSGTVANTNLVNSGALTVSAGTGMTGGGSVALGGTITLSFDYSATLAGNPALAANLTTFASTGLIFEGSTADTFETLLTAANPTADRTITLPNASGTVAVSASGNIALSAAGALSFTGTLPIANGGTNSTATPTAGGLAYGTGTAFAFTAAGTTGQCILSNGASAPTWGACDPANTVTGTGTSGQIAFWNGTSTQTSDSALAWDNTNKRLGIGTAAPASALQVVGDVAATTFNGLTIVTNGTNNFGIGPGALSVNSTGVQNIAIGWNALASNTTGSSNIAIGNFSQQDGDQGLYNVSIGEYSMQGIYWGIYNTALGSYALRYNDGDYNTGLGSHALSENTTGSANTGLGYEANKYNQTGSNGVYIGYQAGRGTIAHNKSGNVFIGYQAGYNETGSNLLYIANSNTATPLIKGDFAASLLTVNGTLTATNGLSVTGSSIMNGSLQIGSIVSSNALTVAAPSASDWAAGFYYGFGGGGKAGAISLARFDSTVGATIGLDFMLQNTSGVNKLFGYIGTEIEVATDGAESGALVFNTTTNGVNRQEQMRLSSSGKLGLGTNNPNQHLEVSGSGDQYIRVTSSNNAITGLDLYRPGLGNYDWRMYNTGGVLTFGMSDDNLATISNKLSIQASGNMAVGSGTSSNSVLYVNRAVANTAGDDIGLYTNVSQMGDRASGGLVGGQLYANFSSSTGSINNVTALKLQANASVSGGTVSYLQGFTQWSSVTAGATATNIFNMRVDDAGGTGSITNQVGLVMSNLTRGTNNTGILLGTTFAPAGNFGIYNSMTYDNYFAGNINIGGGSGITYNSTFKTYASSYSVNTATPAALLDNNGAPFSVNKSYKVQGVISATSSKTGATAYFYGNGTTFTLTKSYEADTASNSIEFFLNGNVPSVRVYNHAQFYSVSVKVEEMPNFGRGGSENYIYANGSGNIGIGGTTNPGVALQIKSVLANTPTLGSGAVGGLAITSANELYGLYIGIATNGDTWFQSQRNDGAATVYNLLLNPSGGNVGIGSTTSPSYKLDVTDSQASNYVMRINNTNTANTADGLLINLGVAVASRGTGNYFVGFAGAGAVAGKIQGGASAVAYTTTAADFAEYFLADNPLDLPQPGELVSVATGKAQTVTRTISAKDKKILGIVSTNPAFIGNGPICTIGDENCDADYAKTNVIVALSGQVPVKVSIENGDIQAGDLLTSSSIPGVAMKANVGDVTIGTALGSFAELGVGKIVALVNLQNDGALLTDGSFTSAHLLGITQTNATTIQTLNLNVNGALLVTGPAEFRGPAIFKALAEFIDRVIFNKEVEFKARAYFNQDTTGTAVIRQGSDRVEVVFSQSYQAPPAINVALELSEHTEVGDKSAAEREAMEQQREQELFAQGYQYFVKQSKGDKFTIILNKPAVEDVRFSWTALSSKESHTTVSN